MILLLFFAFVSGLITIAAPCIWPLLPIILSATTSGGHRKPLGITLGIIISFGLLTLFLSSLLAVIPFNANALRIFAVIVILILGLVLLIPRLSTLLEGWVSRLSGKFQISGSSKNGFSSGFITGLALGVVWSPCAGPILATIATLAATQKVSIELILVTASYCIGIAIPLFVFATLGRNLLLKTRLVSQYTGRIQQVFGVVMILTAILIATNYDTVLEAKLLNYFPSYSQFLNSIEGNGLVFQQLKNLKQQKSVKENMQGNSLFNVDYPAPEFIGITKWLNLSQNQAIPTIQDLRGKVVLVDFWTYTCINCIRTLPHVTSWYDTYKNNGFVVIGVHTPEFAFEHDSGNVVSAIQQFGIHYPVAQDNNYATWNNYQNQYWPAEYLIDARGNVRRTHFGEGEYDQTEKAIQELLREAGQKIGTGTKNMTDTTPIGNISPETYLGSSRMQYYYPTGALGNGTQTFTPTNTPPTNSFSYGGTWTIQNEFALTSNSSVLIYHFLASKVFIILRPPANGGSATVKVLLDGKQIDQSVAGADVINGEITITTDRLYDVVDFHGNPQDHVLRLEFLTPAVQAYTFTFG